MNEKSWLRVLNSYSGNRKSKIANLKWLAFLIIAFVLAMCGVVAQAQQPTKVPRVGFLTANDFSARAWVRGGEKHCH